MDLDRARLPRAFFARDACTVARDLLGRRLLAVVDGRLASGLIVEAEAYCQGPEPDLACHGAKSAGRPTARTAPMFGPAGHAYVYFTYGMHWMFNVVTGNQGQASAVLIRALTPEGGLDAMRQRRGLGVAERDLCRGPARLAQALGIDGDMSGLDLCSAEDSEGVVSEGVSDGPGIRDDQRNHSALTARIWLEAGHPPPADRIRQGPRIGLGKTPEPWLSMPWRYWLAENRFVSVNRV
ncbi:MAG: DNA-3-methyladenine glycosylase [Anaerolineae bacterium]